MRYRAAWKASFLASLLSSLPLFLPFCPKVNNTGEVSGFYIDKKGVSHGFTLNLGRLTTLSAPGATSTAAFGLNNNGQVVGTYTDAAGLVHGFVYQGGKFQPVDDPNGVGATIINGINDHGWIVGFYGPCTTGGTTCHGFVGTP
jgi:probable HAF family extracellular repeat protein